MEFSRGLVHWPFELAPEEAGRGAVLSCEEEEGQVVSTLLSMKSRSSVSSSSKSTQDEV